MEAIRKLHPENRCARYLTRALFLSFSAEQRARLRRCCASGVDHPDSAVGCYILHPHDLEEFRQFFDPVILDCHHVTMADAVATASPDDHSTERWDVSTLGLPALSTRIRVARNLSAFNLAGHMNRVERTQLERVMQQALTTLIDDPRYGGRFYSLTPEVGHGETNPHLISQREHQALVDAHIMFRRPDRYQASAGIADDWPYGRACYVSADRSVIVWIGEEDHLRIISMGVATALGGVYERLNRVLDIIEAIPEMSFARDERFGYITSCPSNLGTGMRASVHVTLAQLNRDTDDIMRDCARLGLSVCGSDGDRTPIGASGTLDLSPTRRLFISEHDIIDNLFEGLRALVQ